MAERKVKAPPSETSDRKITESIKTGDIFYVTVKEAAHIKTVAANVESEGKTRNKTNAKIWAACNRAHLKNGENVLSGAAVAPEANSAKQGQKVAAADSEAEEMPARPRIKFLPIQRKTAEPEAPVALVARSEIPCVNAVMKIAEAIQKGEPYYVTTKEASYITRVASDGAADKMRGTMRDMILGACHRAYLESGENALNSELTIAPSASSAKQIQKATAADSNAGAMMEAPKAKQAKQQKTTKSETSAPTEWAKTSALAIRLRKVAIIHAIDAFCNGRATSEFVIDQSSMAKVRAAAKGSPYGTEDYMKVKFELQKLSQCGDSVEIDLADYAQLLASCPALSIFEGILIAK